MLKNSYSQYGALYGRLRLENLDKITSNYSEIEISLEGTKHSTYPDEDGVYFIENIKPGIYTINFNFNDENLAQIKNFRIKSKSLALIRDVSGRFRKKIKKQTIVDWLNIERYVLSKSPLGFGDFIVKLPLIDGERKLGFATIDGIYGTASDSTGTITIKKLPGAEYIISISVYNKPYEIFTNNYLQVKIKSNQILTMKPESFFKNVTIEPILRDWETKSTYTNKEEKK